jgi:hypothetical protein
MCGIFCVERVCKKYGVVKVDEITQTCEGFSVKREVV